jgi:hypothetical protein
VLLINDGNGRLIDESSQCLPRTNHDSEDIAVEDFDGDGDFDIVFVSEDDRRNEYYENTGGGFFTEKHDKFPVHGISNAVESGDFNQDGALDLLIGNAGQNHLFLNNGKGTFLDASHLITASTQVTQDIASGDIDGDGDIDLVEGNESGNRILLGNGRGEFVVSEFELPANGGQTRDVDLADMDQDGDLDLLVANVNFSGKGDPANQLYLNNGKGEFELAKVPFSEVLSVDIAAFDINRDGVTDIVSGNRWNGNEELVFTRNIEGQWVETSGILPDINSYTFDFNFADFDGDGLTDIYLCNFRGNDRLLFATE